MTQEDILRMAREAGMTTMAHDSRIERFATLVAAAERERAIGIAKGMQEELQAKFEQTYMEGVIAGAAAEREACAKVCEGIYTNGDGAECWLQNAAAAIRARNNQ